VLLAVDHVILPIAFAVHVEIYGDTLEIMHLESLPHQVGDLPKKALVNNDEKIIDLQNDCGNNYVLILAVEDELFSVDM